MEETPKPSKRTAPLWITVVAIIATICASSALVLGVTQNFEIPLPYLEEYLFVEPDLIVEDRSYQYDMATMRYDNITLTVRNTDIDTHAGTILVTLYAVGSVEIASAQTTTGSVAGGVAVAVTAQFTWVGSYTVADIASGGTQVQQTA